MSHFIDIENAIAERLTQKLADMQPKPRVFQSRDLSKIKDVSQGELSVFVTYNGIVSVEEAAPNAPAIGHITNEYLIWVVARSASQHGTQAGTKELADPVLERVIGLLMGVNLIKGLAPLRIAPSGLSPAYSDNGFGYFPLAFHHRKPVRGGL